MTKEPNKDFRRAVRELISNVHHGGGPCPSCDQATTRIFALCKEMLVPERRDAVGRYCRQHLLKQLGENIK